MADDRIISRLIHGDRSVFDELFVLMYDALCQYSFSIVKSDHDAEDIVQEVFITLWIGRSELGVHTNLRSYLYRAVRNRSIDFLRKTVTRSNIIEHAARISETDQRVDLVYPAESEEMKLKKLTILVSEEAGNLPERCREIYFLKYRDGFTMQEISDILEITPKTVEMRLRDAILILREKLHGNILDQFED